MTEYGRNIAIGLTVIIGLGMLCALIFVFAGLPQMFQGGYTLEIHFEQTHDIVPGDPLYLRGKRVGVVTEVGFTDGDPRRGVTITARVDSDYRLPGNIQAKVFTRGLTGKGYLSLIPEGPLAIEEETGKVLDFYATDATIRLRGIHDAGGGLLPPELTAAMTDFGKLARSLNSLLGEEPPASQPTTSQAVATTAPASQPSTSIKGTIIRMNRTLDALYVFVGDPKNQANLKTALDNLAKASGTADELMRRLMTDAEGLSKLLTAFQTTIDQINKGEGTAGKLLTDPKLYNSLLAATEQLEALLKDLQRLAEKWETKGVGIQLK